MTNSKTCHQNISRYTTISLLSEINCIYTCLQWGTFKFMIYNDLLHQPSDKCLLWSDNLNCFSRKNVAIVLYLHLFFTVFRWKYLFQQEWKIHTTCKFIQWRWLWNKGWQFLEKNLFLLVEYVTGGYEHGESKQEGNIKKSLLGNTVNIL